MSVCLPCLLKPFAEMLKKSALLSLLNQAIGASPAVRRNHLSVTNVGNSTLKKPVLRGLNVTDSETHSMVGLRKATMPCQCEKFNPKWKKTTRTVPKCIFIDLGAADGNSFNEFLSNKYGPIANCPNGQWEAILVEANPRFNGQLTEVVNQHNGLVHANMASAAYMCEGHTFFYLDTHNVDHNFWGSSMSDAHPDAQKSGLTKVEVPTVNLNRVLFEQTIPKDWVMVKMDIEGSEWDVLPCLAASPSAVLIDRMYVEQHPQSWGLAGTTGEAMEAAKARLRQQGVDLPSYFSHTF